MFPLLKSRKSVLQKWIEKCWYSGRNRYRFPVEFNKLFPNPDQIFLFHPISDFVIFLRFFNFDWFNSDWFFPSPEEIGILGQSGRIPIPTSDYPMWTRPKFTSISKIFNFSTFRKRHLWKVWNPNFLAFTDTPFIFLPHTEFLRFCKTVSFGT